MAGTKAGAAKAQLTIRRKYGNNFFRTIGSKGGQNGNTGGFASHKVGPDGLTGRERARAAGAIGGRNSARWGVKNGEGKAHQPKNYIWKQ